MADILPFDNLLSVAVGREHSITDPHLFPSVPGRLPWDTQRLTNLLTAHSKEVLGNLSLTVNTYRQISNAIRQKHVDAFSTEPSSVGALQTCHSEETERQH